jgi:hypothetical protein
LPSGAVHSRAIAPMVDEEHFVASDWRRKPTFKPALTRGKTLFTKGFQATQEHGSPKVSFNTMIGGSSFLLHTLRSTGRSTG